MSKRILAAGGALLLAGGAVAYLVTPRREATTSSPEAYTEFREGEEDVQRIYLNDARRHFAKAIEKDPNFVMALTRLALLEPEGDLAAAQGLLARAAAHRALVTRRERLALDMARAIVAEKTAEAIDLARKLKDDYHDTLGYETLSRLLADEGKPAEAEGVYREMLRYDPNSAIAYNSLGYAAAQRGNFAEAIADLKKYAYMAPGQANPFDSLGEVETACGRYDEAIANLKHALAIKPDFYASYTHLGLAYATRGDYPSARDCYEKAYAMATGTPERAGLGLDLFAAALYAKDFEEARSITERIAGLKLEHVPNPAPLMRAVLASEEGHEAEARELLARMPACAPAEEKKYRDAVDRLVQLAMARIEFNSGHYPKVVELLEGVMSRMSPGEGLADQSNAMRWRALEARARARMGDFEGAEKLLAVNRGRNPNDFLTRQAEQEVAQLQRRS